MSKRSVLLLSFLFYGLSFLFTFVVKVYPLNMIIGSFAIVATLGSFGVEP